MNIRFRRAPSTHARRMLWTAAIPAIASLGGAALSSSGSKKAANASGPGIPKEFRGGVSDAMGLLRSRMQQGFPSFPGGAIHPLQAMAMGQMGSSFGAGQAGLDSARQTIESLSATGMDPNAINTANAQLSPYFDFLRNQGLAQTREGEAQGGRFFGSGGTGAEGLFLSNLAGQQSAQTLPLALQMTGLRLGAAQSLPGFMGGQQQLGMNLFNTGGAAHQQELAEFLRTQPEAAIPLLASLMQGTPFAYNPAATQFGQVLGGNVNSALGSGGFWDWMRSLNTGGGGGGLNTGGTGNPGASLGYSGNPFSGD